MAVGCLHCGTTGEIHGAVRVRYHFSRGALGDLPGPDGYSDRLHNLTTVTFDQREFVPGRNDLLVFESGEVLQVGQVMPAEVRTDFRRADVAQLEQAAFSRYPFLSHGQPWAGLTPPED